MSRVIPYGSWSSQLPASRVAAAARRLGLPRWQRGALTWLERRPEQAGRQVVVRRTPDGRIADATPPDVDVGTTAHEYGGGDYGFVGEQLVYAQRGRSGIQRLGQDPVPDTRADAAYADFEGSPDGRFLLAIEETRPADGEEARNSLVAFDLERGRRLPVMASTDFVAAPRFSPDGQRLAFVVWNHPNMPWDATELREIPWSEAGPSGSSRRVAGGDREAILQPRFSPGGTLTFISDRSGFWNLYHERNGEIAALCPQSADFGRPPWVFGQSNYAYTSEREIVCSYCEAGFWRLARLDLESGRLEPIPLPYLDVDGVQVDGSQVAFVGGRPDGPAAICVFDGASGRSEEVARAFDLALDPDAISVASAVSFPSAAGRVAHAFVYAPRSRENQAPVGERPPLLVKSHGGPTSAASPALQLGIQYWTSRGFAVVDVNYGGSSGFGRAYRELLQGAWGVVDVEDCEAAARFVADQGDADPARTLITGGSAGGYTTLCALTFRDAFAAGASYYGIGDLEALARDTHKFESRYLDGLVGPYPETRDRYRERSPIHHVERLACPVIFFQGLEDRVVPPNQAKQMVAALAARGLPHQLVTFEGEGHGFRRAENIERALSAELAFYGRVLGFATDSTS